MMNRRYSVFLCVLFAGFLGCFSLAHIFTGDVDFSPNENRYLTGISDVSVGVDALFSGKTMREFESYVTDQFPLRDSWISLKSTSERLSGKRENNGVYFGSQDTLISKATALDWEQVEENLSYVEQFARDAAIPVYVSLIPGKITVWADRLPSHAPAGDEEAVMERAAQSELNWVDLQSALTAHQNEYVYYRTDHHWTSLGAYYGYRALMEAMEIEPVSLADYPKTTVSTNFYGTTYSSSGVRWVAPDSIDIYVPEDGIAVTSYSGGEGEPGELYAESYLEVKDQYSMFLGGNTPRTVIKTGLAGAPKLLVIRDSYTDSLAPFLTAHFSEIHLVDLRYYNGFRADAYIEEYDIDTALVLYGVDSFVSASSLFLLGMS